MFLPLGHSRLQQKASHLKKFTFLLSFMLGIDSFSSFRLTSVFIVISGVCLVTLSDTSSINGNDTFIGHLLSLSGACLYGVYTTFMKKRVPDESPSMVILLYGLKIHLKF